MPPSKFNQMILSGAGNGSRGSVSSVSGDLSMNEISRDTSSVNTPKFHSSHSSNNTTPQCETPLEPGNKDP